MTENTENNEIAENNVVEVEQWVDYDEEPIEEEKSLLYIWSDVLSNIEKVRDEGINMAVAGRIVAHWPHISFQETAIYHEKYHAILLQFRDELDRVIAENPGAIDFMKSDDIAENHKLYKELVVNWNILLDKLELAWDATEPQAHIDYAAIVDTRAFLFSQTGFAGHLEARGFTADSEEIFEAILQSREENK